MLAAVMPPHNDFHALARYLILGKSGKGSPDRVAWTMAHNMPTDDPLQAATYMTATADLSRRCTNAAYHTIISWGEGEQPTPEVMQEIAGKALTMAGLGEHQALIMGHGDTAHKHLHMMVNRVHPTTGKAWSTSHDFKRFDRIMRELSDAYGFAYVPSHTFDPEATGDKPKKPKKRAHYAAKRGANIKRLQWSRRDARQLADRLSDSLDQASTFDDIMEALAAENLKVERKGKGYVGGNATSYVKLSALGLNASARASARRRPPKAKRKPPSRSIFDVDAVDVARAIGSRDQYRAAIEHSKAARKLRINRLQLLAQLLDDLRQTLKSSTALRPRPSRSQQARATKPGRMQLAKNRRSR